MGKGPIIRLKLKERLGIFSLAVIFSLVLAVITFIFADKFSDIFFALIAEDKKTEVILIKNLIDTKDGKSGTPKELGSLSINPPHG